MVYCTGYSGLRRQTDLKLVSYFCYYTSVLTQLLKFSEPRGPKGNYLSTCVCEMEALDTAPSTLLRAQRMVVLIFLERGSEALLSVSPLLSTLVCLVMVLDGLPDLVFF